MKLAEVKEIYYITHIENLDSIIERGILSHSRAQSISHKKIDMTEVQERRQTKCIPGGGPLHDYANLYFSSRNPMLYKRKDEHKDICVLRISIEVLNISGVVVATANAASDYTSFYPPESGIEKLDRKLIFARKWTDDDPIIGHKKRAAKCAEILIPDCVPPSLIFGAYVSCKENQASLIEVYPNLQIELQPIIFFQE